MRARRLPQRLLSLAWLLLLAHTAWQLAWEAVGSGPILNRFSLTWTLVLAGYGLIGGALGLVGLVALARPDAIIDRLQQLDPARLRPLGRWRWPLAGIALVLPTALAYGPTQGIFAATSLRALVLFLMAGLAAVLLAAERSERARWLGLSVLASAGIFVFAREFAQVSSYPLKMTWSEGNRLWDYSLYFGRDRYEFAREFYWPTYMAPGRHGLWGLVYLLPGPPIWLVRLWDAILWTVPYALVGGLLVRRAHGLSVGWGGGFILWTLLFFAQGPFHAPLILSAALLVAFYDHDRPFVTAVVTGFACFYAGISRWTWLVAPAMWAVAWGLWDSQRTAGFWARLRRPTLYAMVGFAGALASRWVMEQAVPSPGAFYETALTQDLLWYRLLPSPTNPLGLLPSLLLAVGPLLALGVLALRRGWLQWDRLTQLGVAGLLGAFLAVGLTASVKIGGGNNLHNLDMFFVALALLAGKGLVELAKAGRLEGILTEERSLALLALTVVVPAWFVLQTGFPFQLAPQARVQEVLNEIRPRVEAAAEEGEVLIVDQRQLLTFGQLDIPLVMDYELKHLFNQAMGGNEPYFEQFERDLRAERFELIMTFPINIEYQGRSHQFGEENDAFLRHVAEPLLAHYKPVVSLEETGIWLMAPR